LGYVSSGCLGVGDERAAAFEGTVGVQSCHVSAHLIPRRYRAVKAAIKIDGNADHLDVNLGLDACATVFGFEEVSDPSKAAKKFWQDGMGGVHPHQIRGATP